MIFYYLILAIKKVKWFFWIPRPEDLALLDVDARCPGCGARKGRLRCVLMNKPGPVAENAIPQTRIQIRHTCLICGCRWHEDPIAKVNHGLAVGFVLPSVARDEIEKKEDRQNWLASESGSSTESAN